MFEQYKIYVEMADRVSQRRANANTFFLSLNTVILAVVGISGFDIKKFSWIIMLSGLILSYAWFYLLHSYKLLSTGKFEIIHQIEERLPLNLYGYEWYVLEEGRNRAKYWPISHLEKFVPILFGFIYIIFEVSIILGGKK